MKFTVLQTGYLLYMHLTTFVDRWNDNLLEVAAKLPETPKPQGYRLRPSRLGRPAYIQAIEHLCYLHGNIVDSDSVMLGRKQDIFDVGHATEERIINTLRSVGITDFSYQLPVSFELAGYIIEGTADLVIDETVVDIKTASNSNFTRLIKGYADLTYRTQLACYAHGLGLTQTALLLYNKDNSELYYKAVDVSGLMERVSNILGSLKVLEDLTLENAWEYILETMEIPEPVQQMRDKQHTGKYLVPKELQWAPTVRDVLFHTEVYNGTRYVVGVNANPTETIRTL